jgi:tetratricopeptide (TPR) repeat protein
MRFIVSTEMLNERSADLFAAVGLPPLGEKRRAYNETVDLGDLTVEEIMSRDHLDLMVYEAVNDAWTSPNTSAERRNNPFGYQPERLLAARRALAEQRGDPERAVEEAYFRLFDFHQKRGRLHATKVFLKHSGLPSARKAFDAYCTKHSLRLKFNDLPARDWCYLSDMYAQLGLDGGQRRAAAAALAAAPDSSLAHLIAGRAAAQDEDFERAVHLLRKAVELSPTMQDGWYWLARISWRKRDMQVAADAIERAIKLKPESQSFLKLRDLVANSGWNHDAVAAE